MRYVLLLSMLAACGNSLRDDRFPTGSSTIATSRSHDAVYNVNVDEGTVSRTDLATGAVTEVHVGKEPTRIARVGDDLWVTLKGERGIAVLHDDGGDLEVDEVLRSGAEPHSIVASEDGRRVYVALTMSDAVAEYDGRTREKLRTFEVQDQPRYLALHPNGKVLFVASTVNGTLSWVDLKTGEDHLMDPPETSRDTDDGPVTLSYRPTGDVAVNPSGTTVAFPSLYADTTTNVDDSDDPSEPVSDGYGSSGTGISVGRINPALVTWSLDGEGHPVDAGQAIFLGSAPFSSRSDGAPIPVFRSYPTSVTAAPDSSEWLVTMEASNAVVVVHAKTRKPMGGGETMVPDVDMDMATTSTDCGDCGGSTSMPFTAPEAGGFVTRTTAVITTAAGPRGIVFDEQDDAVVHDWLDRSVETLPFTKARDAVRELDVGKGFPDTLYSAVGRLHVSSPSLPDDVEQGRRLFFSAIDTRMSADGAGVSCSTCHMDGRNDGFTWTLRGEPRNTPSLAGPVSQTAPVTWSEEVPSVADEAELTSAIRMGGDGLTDAEAALVQAYVDSTRYPDVKRLGDDDDLVREGDELFHRADVGCGSCHSGDLYTDNASHPILGPLPTQTPTLRGISASPPYFHDGSAPSLEAVVELSRAGVMGDTSMLSAHERQALVAYLESL